MLYYGEKMSKVKTGQTVSVHYVGTFDDGTAFDSSRDRGEAQSFEVGAGQLIAGFDSALTGMVVGETKTISLSPDDAYGESDPELFQDVPTSIFPQDFEIEVGATVHGQNGMGHPMTGVVSSLKEDVVTLDLNHPMAGKNLNFEIELLKID